MMDGEKNYLEYERLYNKIFVFRDYNDLSLLKIKICKSQVKIEYNRGYSYNKYGNKLANTELINVCSESLDEHDGIQYISDVSPLGKWILGKNIGDVFKIYINGELSRYELVNCIDDENSNF